MQRSCITTKPGGATHDSETYVSAEPAQNKNMWHPRAHVYTCNSLCAACNVCRTTFHICTMTCATKAWHGMSCPLYAYARHARKVHMHLFSSSSSLEANTPWRVEQTCARPLLPLHCQRRPRALAFCSLASCMSDAALQDLADRLPANPGQP